jgi:hypothetical protein
MRFTYRLLGLLALLVLVAPSACSVGNDETGATTPTPVPGTDATLAFVQHGTLMLTPGETTGVDVVVKPADHYEVSFYLVGAALDASLYPSTVITGDDGHGSITLRAPNGATSFVLRATVTEGPSADLQVAVSDQGFGSLQINPVYAGTRHPPEWVAKVVSGTSCAALGATLPEDPPGALTAVASPGDPLVIEVAPVGPNLAVVVRGGHYMWGCSDEPNLVANEQKQVDVHIVDKPIDLSSLKLDLALGFTPDPEPWQSLLDTTTDRMVSAMSAPYASEPEALLGTMQQLSSDPVAFAEASDKGQWLAALQAQFASSEVGMGETARAYVAAGVGSAPAQISAELQSLPDASGWSALTLHEVQGVTPPDGGVPADYLMTLTVDPDDTVRLGGTLFWLASRHLGAEADRAAAEELSGATGLADVLAAKVQCTELGVYFGGFEGCNAACLGALCADALGAMWSAAEDSSADAGLVGGITMQVSGGAEFDDYAALTGFDGLWLGSIGDGLAEAGVTGTALAQEIIGGQAP